MKIYVEENYEAMSKKAALIVASQMILKPKSVLGLATGSTPVGMYKQLVEMYKKGEIDFSEITTFNLDEYYGLPMENENSYYSFMMESLFNHVNVPKDQINIPRGLTEDVQKVCLEYEEKIDFAGGIDLQILGIGANGHVGFNEPGDKLTTITHLTGLTEETIRDNSRFFEKKEDVPTKAITMGMATIMKAKKIVLIANGKHKAEAIKEMTSGYLNPKVPASILQAHSDIILVLDKEAASLI